MKGIICLLGATVLFLAVPPMVHSGGWLIDREGPFKGRVVDAETKEPIEGAVIVAQYRVRTLYPIGWRSDRKDIQEALTDKKGEFLIPTRTMLISPLSFGDDTSFLIWKPGYGSYPNDYAFSIFPVKNIYVVKSIKRDSKGNTLPIEQEKIDEGLVFSRKYKKWNSGERADWLELGRIVNLNYPFLYLKDAESKLRNMEIPFDYASDFGQIPDDLYSNKYWIVWRKSAPNPIEAYTVIGLRKLKTYEARRKAMPIPIGEISDYKNQKNFIRLLNEEAKLLGFEPYKQGD